MTTIELNSQCPTCLTIFPYASSPSDKYPRPQPGQPSICCECGALLMFGPDLKLAPMTESRFLSFSAVLQEQILRASLQVRIEKAVGATN